MVMVVAKWKEAVVLTASNAGIVAHYYMDVELQGVLHAVKGKLAKEATSSSSISRIAIADSLAMGDQRERWRFQQ